MPQNPAAKIGTSRTTSKEGILTEISVIVLGERPSESDRRITTIDCQKITLLFDYIEGITSGRAHEGNIILVDIYLGNEPREFKD